jgi:GT2 family glycosyltransferase
MPAAAPDLSIVVMFTHDGEQAAECLQAIALVRTEIPQSELIIVLNRASEAVRSAVADLAPGARVIDSPVNTGTAVGWQLGFNAAQAEFVLLLHEDAEPLPGMTSKLIETLSAEPTAAVVGPWIEELRSAPDVNAGWLQFGRVDRMITPEELPAGLADSAYAVNQISSAISLWRRSAWESIGGFEERTFPAMGVEPDSFAALWARGQLVLVEPEARGRHRGGAMRSAPTLLSGPHVAHFLLNRFLDLWDEKWLGRADWFVGRDEEGWRSEPFSKAAVDAAIARAQELRASPPTLSDPPFSLQHLTNPSGAAPGPIDVDPAMAERLRAAEREVIDGYTRWLIARDIEMTDRYEELYDAYRTQSARAEVLESRSQTLDSIQAGRWWRLRERLAKLLGR